MIHDIRHHTIYQKCVRFCRVLMLNYWSYLVGYLPVLPGKLLDREIAADVDVSTLIVIYFSCPGRSCGVERILGVRGEW